MTLSKTLENSRSYGIFSKLWKKARVYHTLSISRGQSPGPSPPPPWIRYCYNYSQLVTHNEQSLLQETLKFVYYLRFNKNSALCKFFVTWQRSLLVIRS